MTGHRKLFFVKFEETSVLSIRTHFNSKRSGCVIETVDQIIAAYFPIAEPSELATYSIYYTIKPNGIAADSLSDEYFIPNSVAPNPSLSRAILPVPVSLLGNIGLDYNFPLNVKIHAYYRNCCSV